MTSSPADSTPEIRPASAPDPTLLLLPAPRPLRVRGEDAEAFLQGQLSADLRLLGPDRALWSSYNSAKGRMLALPLAMRDGDAIELWLPTELLSALMRRLQMFVLRARVVMTAPAADSAVLGVIGAAAGDWLAARAWPAPAQVMQVTIADGLRVLRLPGAVPRFLVCGPSLVPDALPAGVPNDDAAELAWRLADIEAGIARLTPATQDRWVPQMANLDWLGGISFDKGCYTGQEVVARLHHLGKLKKRMFRLHGTGAPPAPGTSILDAGGDGQSVGEIVDAVPTDGGFVASAVLQLALAESDTLHLAREAETRLGRPQAYVYASG